MPIEWTEKKTEETVKRLLVREGHPAPGGSVYSTAVPATPATLDDLAAAIRGMGEVDRQELTDRVGVAGSCTSCLEQLRQVADERDEARRDLVDARTALEIAKAEVGKLQREVSEGNWRANNNVWMENGRLRDELAFAKATRDETLKLREAEITQLRDIDEKNAAEIATLQAKLSARTQELDNQKAEIDRLKSEHLTINAEPEWVRRMPEWFRAELAGVLYHETLIILGATQRQAIYSLVASIASVDNGEYDVAVQNLHVAAGHALRAAYLARKAGGE